MAVVVKAPNPIPDYWIPVVFLAGSIDMGKAVNWQERVEKELEDLEIIIANPRRDDWDSSWVQDISNDKFREQVTWELDSLELAQLILVYFDPDGPAPITLLELGMFGRTSNMIVCCPEGYWRRGNVQIVCDRFAIPMVETIDQLIDSAKQFLNGEDEYVDE